MPSNKEFAAFAVKKFFLMEKVTKFPNLKSIPMRLLYNHNIWTISVLTFFYYIIECSLYFQFFASYQSSLYCSLKIYLEKFFLKENKILAILLHAK